MTAAPSAAAPVRRTAGFRCPGAAAEVSRGTHLARLAAGWAGCGGCDLRHDLAGAPPGLARRLRRRADPADPFAEPGPHGAIGGVAGAGFSAAVAGRVAAAFAAGFPAGGANPVVVLARDERPAHRALADRVAAALRAGGCDVRHLGLATDPAVRFAVREHAAAGGLWLAAPDRPATHAGIVPVAAGGGPLAGEQRERLRANFAAAATRPVRAAGTDAAADAAAYDRSLWPAFRTLSARTAAVACGSAAVRDRLGRLFAALPDELHVSADADPAAFAAFVREAGAGFGLHVDAAGVRCRAFAADGSPVPWAETVAALAADALGRHRDATGETGTVALAAGAADRLRLRVAAAGGRVREVADDPAALWEAVETGAALAADGAGRAVFATPHGPSADAVRVLAGLLRTAGPPGGGSVRACR